MEHIHRDIRYEPEMERVFELLLNDKIFREAFFQDPEKAIRSAGLIMRSEDIEKFRHLKDIKIELEALRFNEQLVLNSSCGY